MSHSDLMDQNGFLSQINWLKYRKLISERSLLQKASDNIHLKTVCPSIVTLLWLMKKDVFAWIDNIGVTLQVTMSYLQIYQEKIYDLLNSTNKVELSLREHPVKGLWT